MQEELKKKTTSVSIGWTSVMNNSYYRLNTCQDCMISAVILNRPRDSQNTRVIWAISTSPNHRLRLIMSSVCRTLIIWLISFWFRVLWSRRGSTRGRRWLIMWQSDPDLDTRLALVQCASMVTMVTCHKWLKTSAAWLENSGLVITTHALH